MNISLGKPSLDDYFSSGVSTCGCGKDMLKKWFKTDPLPLKFVY